MKVISASRKQLWSGCQQSATSHFNTKRDEEANLDTQNCSHVMSCQTINLIKYKEPWKVNIIISREVEIIAHQTYVHHQSSGPSLCN